MLRQAHEREGLDYAQVIDELPAPESCLEQRGELEPETNGLLALREHDVEIAAWIAGGELERASTRLDEYTALAREFRIPYVVGREQLLAARPQAVLEAASHEAVREHLVPLLEAGAHVVVLSAGALADDKLRREAEAACARSGAQFYVPSGGIGGLDALKAACVAGVEEVTIAVTKPPAAWKGIAYVEALGVDLDRLREPRVLFEGSAREGVPHFPANVNIAAVLSMAGVAAGMLWYFLRRRWL